jgi:hypothetical protein
MTVPCPDCGFVYDEARAPEAAARIRALARDVVAALTARDDGDVRRRPVPDVWSPLEYACHVRDVLLVQRERVLAMRRGFSGEASPMGRDERVEHDGYAAQRVSDVAVEVEHAALLFANVLDRVTPDDWNLTIGYQFPQPEQRSLRWVAVHTEHELVHHLHDLGGAP